MGRGTYIEVVPKSLSSQLQPSQLSPFYSGMTSSSSSSSSSNVGGCVTTVTHVIRGPEKKNFQINMAKESCFSIKKKKKGSSNNSSKLLLTNTIVTNLPVVTAVAPNSPAKRAGLVVGDRIVGVGDRDNTFSGCGKEEIRKCLTNKWGY